MLLRILSNVPWPPRSGPHAVVRVAVAVERDLHAERAERRRADRRPPGVSSRPLVMMLITMLTPRASQAFRQALGQVVHHRQVQQRLAAEERQREALRARSRRIRASVHSATRAAVSIDIFAAVLLYSP